MSSKTKEYLAGIFFSAAIAASVGGITYFVADKVDHDYSERYPSLSAEDERVLETDQTKMLSGLFGSIAFFSSLSGLRKNRRRGEKIRNQGPKL